MEENIYITDFAHKLTKLRLERNISARDMSLSIGQSHNFIHNIESERNFPSMLNFFYICEFLNLSPHDFFGEAQHSALMQELILDLDSLDESQIKKIHEVIKMVKANK